MKTNITQAMFQYAFDLSGLKWSQMTPSQRLHAEYFEATIDGLKWDRVK